MLIENLMATTTTEQPQIQRMNKADQMVIATASTIEVVKDEQNLEKKNLNTNVKNLFKSENLLKAAVGVSCLGILIIILKK